MIDRNHALPLTRQAELVGISRGNVYYLPRAASLQLHLGHQDAKLLAIKK